MKKPKKDEYWIGGQAGVIPCDLLTDWFVLV